MVALRSLMFARTIVRCNTKAIAMATSSVLMRTVV